MRCRACSEKRKAGDGDSWLISMLLRWERAVLDFENAGLSLARSRRGERGYNSRWNVIAGRDGGNSYATKSKVRPVTTRSSPKRSGSSVRI